MGLSKNYKITNVHWDLTANSNINSKCRVYKHFNFRLFKKTKEYNNLKQGFNCNLIIFLILHKSQKQYKI